MSEEARVPTITIRVINRENFTVEINLEDIPGGPDYALNMLATTTRAVEQQRQDQEALAFGKKMEQAANVHNALLKLPKVKM
jgi:hypothetical protein